MNTVGPTSTPARGELLEIITELSGLGLEHGWDFAIAEISPELIHEADPSDPGQIAGEVIVMDSDDDGIHFYYRDMGRYRNLTGPVDLDTARKVFREEASWLAAERRRGPYNGKQRGPSTGATPMVSDQSGSPEELTRILDAEIAPILADWAAQVAAAE